MTSPLVEVAIAVVARGASPDYLIGQRGEGQPLAGYWEFPGGKLQANEAPAQAAERECLEETGLAVMASHALAVVEHDYPHARVRLHFMACVLKDAQQWQVAAPHQWVASSALGEYRFPPANRELLALLTTAQR